VPPLVRQRVNVAARECWLAIRDLSDCYLSDCDQMPQEDIDLFGAATAHPGVQEPLSRALANAGGQRPTASGGTSEPPCSAHDLAADALAYACARTVCDGLLNARSQIADALLDYLNIGCGGPDDVPSWMRQYEQRQKPNVGGERTACPKGSNE